MLKNSKLDLPGERQAFQKRLKFERPEGPAINSICPTRSIGFLNTGHTTAAKRSLLTGPNARSAAIAAERNAPANRPSPFLSIACIAW
jgi:hypothetical protein